MGMSASQARLLSLTARMSDLEFQAQAISNSKIRLADESKQAAEDYNRALDKTKYTAYNAGSDSYIDASYSNITSYNQTLNADDTHSKYRMIVDNAGKIVMSDAEINAISNRNTYRDENAYLDAMGVDRTKTDYMTTEAYKYYHKIYEAATTRDNQGQLTKATVIPADKLTDGDYLASQIKHGNYILKEFDKNASPDDGSIGDGKGSFIGVSWDSGDNSIREDDDKRQLAKAEAEYNRTMADIQAKDKRFDLQLKTIDTEHTAISAEMESVKKVIDKNIERSFKIFNA